MSFLKLMFGNYSKREIKRIRPLCDQVLSLEKKYADNNIAVFELPHDCGLSYGRNFLVDKVKTEYFRLPHNCPHHNHLHYLLSLFDDRFQKHRVLLSEMNL